MDARNDVSILGLSLGNLKEGEFVQLSIELKNLFVEADLNYQNALL